MIRITTLTTLIIITLLAVIISSCSGSSDTENYHEPPEHEGFSEVMGLLANSDAKRSETYQDTLDILYDLGIYGFDEGDLSACKNDDLKSHYLQRQLPNDLRKAVQNRFTDASGEEIFDYLVNLADKSEEQINNDLNAGNYKPSSSNLFHIDMESNLLMHLIWLAAEKGSIDALNEIGAAQTYCYQDTEQDIENAILNLQRASDKGDILANMTLGKIYYSGIGGYKNKELGIKHRNIALDAAIKKLRAAEVWQADTSNTPKNPLDP